jgi:hypothetical protein
MDRKVRARRRSRAQVEGSRQKTLASRRKGTVIEMSKQVFMHATAHEDHSCECLKLQAQLGIKWPALPWKCPRCKDTFEHAKSIVAASDSALVLLAKGIVEKGKRELERAELDESERKRIRLTMNLAQDFVDDPASFLCRGCYERVEDSKASTITQLIDALLEQIGNAAPKPTATKPAEQPPAP